MMINNNSLLLYCDLVESYIKDRELLMDMRLIAERLDLSLQIELQNNDKQIDGQDVILLELFIELINGSNHPIGILETIVGVFNIDQEWYNKLKETYQIIDY